jgi:hypothetical protein
MCPLISFSIICSLGPAFPIIQKHTCLSKDHPCTLSVQKFTCCHEGKQGKWKYNSNHLLTSARYGGEHTHTGNCPVLQYNCMPQLHTELWAKCSVKANVSQKKISTTIVEIFWLSIFIKILKAAINFTCTYNMLSESHIQFPIPNKWAVSATP